MKTEGRIGWWIGTAGICALAGWFAWITWFTDAGIRRFEQHMQPMAAPPDAPRTWCAQRFFVEPDSYYWLAFARELRESNGWRLRYTVADNAPYGRPMTHWSHLVIWGLMATSRMLETAAHLPPALALELAGRILLPAAGVLFLGSLFLLLGRRLGWLMAALVVGALATSNEILWVFNGLRPDHHGFQLAFAAGMWLCLALGGMGRVRRPTTTEPGFYTPDLRAARHWFILSGLLGGAALWVGGTAFLFTLCATAAGASLAWFSAQTSDDPDGQEWAPGLWRLWAVTGSLVGLCFYALEFAPAHFAMRLEVNHPLYALCWLGTGECLHTLFSWRKNGKRLDWKTLATGLGGLLAVAVLPLLILFGPVDWYLPRTKIMLTLHSQYILEFHTLSEVSGGKWLGAWIKLSGIGALALLGTAWMLGQNRQAFRLRTALTSLWAIAVFFTGLYFWQVRWAPFALASSMLVVAFWLTALREDSSTSATRREWRGLPAVVAALLVVQILVGAFQVCQPLARLWRVEMIDGLWLKTLLQRNLMLQLRQCGNGVRMRIMAPPEMVPAIWYFGLGDSVGSLMWENLDGLEATAAFFGDPLPGERARAIARERGITHVLISAGAFDALMFQDLATGRDSQPEAAVTVGGAAALSGAQLPAWLQVESNLTASASQTYGIAVPAAGGWVPANLSVQIYQVVP